MKDYLLEPEEWDFSGIPSDELESAWFYELARTTSSCVMDKEAFPDHLVDNPPRKLDWDNDDDRRYWYENTIGWYDEWAIVNDVYIANPDPWIEMPRSFKKAFMLAHLEQIPAHLTTDPNYRFPYSKSFVHLEYNPEPNSSVLCGRHKYLKAQQRPLTSLHLFEMRHIPDTDTRRRILKDFEEFLDREFPTLSKKTGCPETKLPNLTDLGVFRMLELYTPEETAEKISRTYSQRRRTTPNQVIKAEKAIHKQMRKFCQPHRPKFPSKFEPTPE
jgi:hypothetical protein